MTVKFPPLREVVALVDTIISEFGPNHHGTQPGGSCWYMNYDGTPSCIVGHVIDRLTDESLILVIARSENTRSVRPILEERDDIFDVTPEVIDYLADLQICQDQGCTWGTAQRLALKRLQAR